MTWQSDSDRIEQLEAEVKRLRDRLADLGGAVDGLLALIREQIDWDRALLAMVRGRRPR
jgi:hypothetical protein